MFSWISYPTAQENHFGADTTSVGFLTATEASDVDDLGTTSISDDIAFSLVAGTWNVSIYIITTTSGATDNNLAFYQVNSGVDDTILTSASPYHENITSDDYSRNATFLKYDYLNLDSTTQFYFVYYNISSLTDEDFVSYYLQLERLG